MTEIIRDSSLLQSGGPSALGPVRRSITGNSHYSQPSITASTRSWVYSNQQNPPPPPEEAATPVPSPYRTPRPLTANTGSWVYPNQQIPPSPPEDAATPVPSPYRIPRPLPDPQYQPRVHPPQNHMPGLHTTNGLASPVLDDDEEYMSIDAHAPGMALGYLAEGLGRGRVPADAINSSRGNLSVGGRSFVGGFVNSLRRFPRVVFGYKTGAGGKRTYSRRATLDTEGTNTDGTGRTTGNTLPRYTSNPSTPVAGPSNLRQGYFQEPSPPMPPLDFHLIRSANLRPSLSQRRRRPAFHVTPPSDVMEQDEMSQNHSQNHAPGPVTRNSNVTIYNLPQGEDPDLDPSMRRFGADVAGTDPPHAVIPPSTAPTTNRHTMTDVHTLSHHRQPSTLSHHQQPSTHATHTSHVANPAPVGSPPLQSPVLAHPLPTADYRKMTLSSTVASPQTYGSSTISDGPSFSSQLHPIYRFFRNLYHLPWIATDRVTADYRPVGRGRTIPRKDSKKQMASWYRGKPGVVLSGGEKVDLLSSAEASKRASGNTASTPLAAHPMLNYRPSHTNGTGNRRHHSRRHHNHNQPITNHHHRRNPRRRRTILSTTTASAAEVPPQPHHRHHSPIIPTVYPYPYPYPYAYPTFQSASPPLMPPLPPPPALPSPYEVQRTHSSTTPRGPRPAPTGPVYPHGYTPFPPPPPTYMLSQGSPGAGDPGQQHQHVQMPVYVPMQFIPGATMPPPPPSPPPIVAQPTGQGSSGTPAAAGNAVLQPG